MKFKHYLTLLAIFSFSIMRSQSGTHLNFDGVDDHVVLPNEGAFDFATQMTVEFWMNSSVTPDQWDALVAKGDNSWRVALDATGTIAFAGQLAFADFYSTTVVTDGAWHHVAVTYNGTNAIIYIDGVQENSVAATANINNGAFLVAIGENLQATGRFYSGNLDDVRIWNVARTEEQINASRNCELLGSETGLVSYYKFNQGIAAGTNTGVTSLTDATASPNNGTLTNFGLTSTTSNWISGSPIVSGLICCPNVTTWNGTSWSNGLPSGAKLTVFTGDYTGIGFDACSIQVKGLANVTINANENLAVTDAVTVTAPATFTLSNNANLIQLTNATNIGDITVIRSSNTLKRLDYTAWSSPVTGPQTLLDFSPLTLANRFYGFKPDAGTNGLYDVITSPSTQTFTAGKGYLIRMPDNLPLAGYNDGTASLAYPGSFTGVPNNGDVSVTLFSTGGENSYNLVGNPYPSVINVQDFLFVNDGLIGGTIYFWRKENAAGGTAYATRTNIGGTATSSSEIPNEFIQVGQGFLVKSLNLGTTVIPNFFTNLMRPLNPTSTQFFKTKRIAGKSRVWLNLTNTTGAFSQALIGYTSEATLGVDKSDGKYINDSPIALTSNINNEEYVIQGRPSFVPSDVVSLNFKTATAGQYTIAIDHVDGLFLGNQDIYLVDSKTGIETNLKTGSYNFTADAVVDNTRFTLKFQKTLSLDAQELNDNSVIVYKNGGVIYVNSGAKTINNIKVFDIQGRVVAERNNVKANTSSFQNLRASNQVLIVKVTTDDNQVISKKVEN